MPPFSREQFVAVFASYNDSIWPVEILAYLLGIIIVALLFWPVRISNRIIPAILAGMWAWTGIVYHWLFFSSISETGLGFGVLFIIQAIFIIYAGVFHDDLRFGFQPHLAAWVGIALVGYAAIVYPAIGLYRDGYPSVPMFGVAPCPVTIFTFGLLLLTTNHVPYWALVIPFLWSLLGISVAVNFGVVQDWGLLLSGFISVPLLIWRDRHAGHEHRLA